MDSYTERFSEVHSPLVLVSPAVQSAGAEVISSYVSVANYHRLVLLIQVGALSTGTVKVRLIQAKNTAGLSAKGIPDTATQDKITSVLTSADANSIAVIELRQEELDVNNGFTCVAVGFDVDTNTVGFSAVLLGIGPSYVPVSATPYNEIVG